MADGLHINTSDGLILYAVVRRISDGLCWAGGTTYLERTPTNWTSIARPMTKTVIVANVVADYDNPLAGLSAGTYDAEVSIQVGGTPDPSVDGEASWVFNSFSWDGTSSSIPVTQQAAPSGYVAIDHNSGGIDNLTINDINSVPIAGALIQVYGAADFAARGASAAKVMGWTLTNALGHWNNPVYVPGGSTYTVVASAPGDQSQSRNIAA